MGNHYLPDFIERSALRQPPQPLHLVQCTTCSLLQLADTTPRTDLYHERYGFKSGVNEAIRADLKDVVDWALARAPRTQRWLDIACNDGTLLSNVPQQIKRVGVDPLTQFAPEALTHADCIVSDYFQPGYFTEPFDVITSVSMFYDLDDPNEFVADVRDVLAPHGIWVIQQNYALDMLRMNAIDNVCHEHVTYFSVMSMTALLERHGLEINEVSYSPVNGGCVRTLVSRIGARSVDRSVFQATVNEQVLRSPAAIRLWTERVMDELRKTRWEVEKTAADGGETWVYGASTRGGTILQLLNLGPDLLPFAVERQPAKWGKVMAATDIPIISERVMREDPPAALLVSPWFFRRVFEEREDEYLRKGGRMIFPLPTFDVVFDR
jgi:SAM-dependent methyltransferase